MFWRLVAIHRRVVRNATILQYPTKERNLGTGYQFLWDIEMHARAYLRQILFLGFLAFLAFHGATIRSDHFCTSAFDKPSESEASMIISRQEDNLFRATKLARDSRTGIVGERREESFPESQCRSILPLSMETISIDVGCMWVTGGWRTRYSFLLSGFLQMEESTQDCCFLSSRPVAQRSLYDFTAVAFVCRNSIDRKSHFLTRLTRFRFDFLD
jgi:hypothetical protein